MLLGALAVAALALGPAGAAPRTDFAATAYDILVPGENGSVSFNRNTDDQAKLYDALTPLQGRVTAQTIRRLYKPERFGGKGRAEDIGRDGVAVVRDGFGVAHVTAKTRAGL